MRILCLAAIMTLLSACVPKPCSCPTPPKADEVADEMPGPAARGPVTAFVVIEEFSDFECPYCGRIQSTLHELRQRYPEQLRHVFRHLPLGFHVHAMDAARASVAAQKQGRFWEYHDRLFEARGKLDMPALVSHAEALGMQMRQFERDIESTTTTSRIDRDISISKEFDINGVPTFLINGRRVVGAVPIDRFVEIIDEEIAKGEALVKEGVDPPNVARILTEKAPK